MRKILIAEDNEMNRAMLHRILDEEYEVLEATDGKEALSILHRKHKMISAVLLDIAMPVMDGFEVLRAMRNNAVLSQIPVIVATGSHDEDTEVMALSLGANDFITKPYNAALLLHCLRNTINLRETASIINAIQRDKLTGLYNREAFFDKAAGMIKERESGYYLMSCFDIDNFKLINDQYGAEEGDRILRNIGKACRTAISGIGGICCRISADNFAMLYHAGDREYAMVEELRNGFSPEGCRAVITFSIGRYVITDLSLSASTIYDRAYIAKRSVKGRYDAHIAYFNDSMLEKLIREQQIITEMDAALGQRQFEVWYQPQYNHSTGAMIGSEALARWRHPVRGLISPKEFIPVFEQNGFVYELDKYIWEQVCRHIRTWLDKGIELLPVSVNISRYDIFRADLVDVICSLVEKYDVPVELLRLEITESAFAKSSEQIITVVMELMERGFIVEIDDFGSGYSSLNTLKDVPANVLKLDMRFLDSNENSQRGGNILESIVRMAKWLNMSIIAEGVETMQQADFLKSIGCSYVQGFLYAEPMPMDQFEALMTEAGKESRLLTMETVANLDNNAFWDPRSMDTLVFNSYIGGACIFEYHLGSIEMLRVNDKYAQVLGIPELSHDDALKLDWNRHLDKRNLDIVDKALRRSSLTGNEVSEEFEILKLPGCPAVTYLHSTFRVIASCDDRYLVYCMNENITAQREADERERLASEQVQTVINDVGSGITAAVLRDGKMQFLLKNDKYLEIIGYTREQFDSEVTDVYKLIYPEDIERSAYISADAYYSRRNTQFDFRIIRRDGAVRWTRAILTSARLAGIEPTVQLCVLTDVTAEIDAEQALQATDEHLKFLNETAHELLAQTDSDRGVGVVLQKLLNYFGAARARVFELDYDAQSASSSYEARASGEKGDVCVLPFSAIEYWFNTFEKQGFLNIPRVDALGKRRAKEKAALKADGIASLLAVPLRRGGRLIGFLCVDGPTRQQSHIERMAAIGDYIAVMLTRRDLDAKIISDNQTLISLMNDTPGGFVRMRVLPNGVSVPVYFNEGFCNMCGMSLEELTAMYGSDSMAGVHPEDMSVVRDTVQHMLRDGTAQSARYRLLHGSGGYIWVTIFGRVTRDEAGGLFFNVYYTNVGEGVERAEHPSNHDQKDEWREQNKRFKLLADNIPGGLATYRIMPGSLELVYFNDGFARLTGCTSGEYEALSKKYPLSHVFEEDAKAVMKLGEALCQGTAAAELVLRIHTKGGGQKWISGKAAVASRSGSSAVVNVLILDVSELRESMELLRISEEEHRLATEHSGNLICRYSIAERLLTMSKESAATRELPEAFADMPAGPIRMGLVEEGSVKDFEEFFENINRGEPSGDATFQWLLHGKWNWVHSHFSSVLSGDGKPVSAVVSFVDVTEQFEKETVYKKWTQSLLDRDPSTYSLYRCNLSKNGFPDIMEGSLLEIRFSPDRPDFNERTKEYVSRYVFTDDKERYLELMDLEALLAGFYRGKRSHELEYREALANGAQRWLKLTADLVEYPNSSDVEAYLMYEDIDEAKRNELLSKERAEKDALTGVLNRATFVSRMEDIIAASGRGAKHALLMLDLDGFKLVNDVFGHVAGDQALIDVASATSSALRRGDLIGRLGGDEFLVFLGDIPNDAVAMNIARRICSLVRRSFSLEVQISGSIGIVICPRDGTDFDSLYRKVDAALYFVKGSGKNNYAFYHENMENEHLELEVEEEPYDEPYFVKKEKKRRMLIVDDSQMDYEFLNNIFKNEFMIEKARDGASALTRLKHYGSAISVVLLDLLMPGLDGFEVLDKMQASPDMKSIPVVVVSVSDDRETSLKAIRHGASDFVTKPVDSSLLRIRVESAISKGENERLRAQNSSLKVESSELSKYRMVLERTGTVLIDHDWLRGTFTYDSCISQFIDGDWDGRKLWHILLTDMVADVATVKSMQELVHDLAEDRGRTEDCMSVELRTPGKVKHGFLMNAYKLSNDYQLTEHIIITFNDTGS